MANNVFKSVFDFLAKPIIFSFLELSLIMGASVILLFGQKKIFAGMIVSYFLAMAFALPLWYTFPVNSPNNYFLSRNLQIKDYEPVEIVVDLQEGIREAQKDSLPISTFPSAHVMWGMETAYFWALYRRWTMIVFVPWFLLMTLGTVYLAQHWAIDVLVAIPLAIIAIVLARFFVEKIR
jgi:membrane-associated phospholipid phosphatase